MVVTDPTSLLKWALVVSHCQLQKKCFTERKIEHSFYLSLLYMRSPKATGPALLASEVIIALVRFELFPSILRLPPWHKVIAGE